jgi:hypothetical protein
LYLELQGGDEVLCRALLDRKNSCVMAAVQFRDDELNNDAE